MRDIKFRAKLSYADDWVYGSLVRNFLSKSCQIRDVANIFYPVANETICEYVGVHDKNGKEVYKGDVIFYRYVPEEESDTKLIEEMGKTGDYGYIEWRNGRFVIVWVDYKDEGEPFEESELYEVVGNIYDNPELIKEKRV